MSLWIKIEAGKYVNVSESRALYLSTEKHLFKSEICNVVADFGLEQTTICTLPSREEAKRVLLRIAADLGAKSYTDYTQAEPREANRQEQ